MIRFEYEAAKSGCKVVTRDGREARIVCWDALTIPGHPLMALVKSEDGTHEESFSYTTDGCLCLDGSSSSLDLFLESNRISGWINLYKVGSERVTEHTIYPSRDAAYDHRNPFKEYITSKYIDWRE